MPLVLSVWHLLVIGLHFPEVLKSHALCILAECVSALQDLTDKTIVYRDLKHKVMLLDELLFHSLRGEASHGFLVVGKPIKSTQYKDYRRKIY